METIIVYVDDTDYACQLLAPMMGARQLMPPGGKTHWVLVACPPRLSQHAARWLDREARESWRAEWKEQALAPIAAALQRQGDAVTAVLARGTLVQLTDRLLSDHPAARVLDARRPRFGEHLQPVTRGQPDRAQGRWEVPGAMAGVGAFLLLAAD